jgi:hypothetical protein
VHALWEEKRYWWEFSEWATLPHLIYFNSFGELFEKVSILDAERTITIQQRMEDHHRRTIAGNVAWWKRSISWAVKPDV